MISNSIAFYLLKNNFIKEKELPIYRYGFSALLNSLFQLVVILILGAITNKMSETIVFILMFVFLRRFLGGYHANTKIRCLMLDIVIWVVTTNAYTVCNSLKINNYVVLIIISFSVFVTFRFAPVENMHKPLNKIQKKKNAKKGRMLVYIFVMVALGFYKTGCTVSYTMFATMLAVAVLILVEGRKNAKRKSM